MSRNKGRTQGTTQVAEPTTEPVVEQSLGSPELIPTARLEAPSAKEPVNKRGKSSIENPVGATWVLCHNAFATARAAGTAPPSRKALVAAAIDAGIAYYTSKTQVQAYLKASGNGAYVPAKLPRNVTIA